MSDIDIHSLLSEAISDKIEELESHMAQQPQVEIEAISNNVNGMYTREILIKKDTLLTGRVHLFDYVDIMLSGDITIRTPDGLTRYTGPNVFYGPAGRKRVGYAHEDTRWITVHNTPITSGEDFYNLLTVATMADYQDKKDYELLLDQMNLTQEQVDAVVKNEGDILDVEDIGAYVDEYKSHGMGLFASKDYGIKEFICIAGIDGKRTIAGRYSNHSINPNAQMIVGENQIDLVAIKEIGKDEEITTNYRDTLQARGVLCQQ